MLPSLLNDLTTESDIKLFYMKRNIDQSGISGSKILIYNINIII